MAKQPQNIIKNLPSLPQSMSDACAHSMNDRDIIICGAFKDDNIYLWNGKAWKIISKYQGSHHTITQSLN